MCLAWLRCITSESQWLQYFKLVFLEIQNVPLRTVFANPVTIMSITGEDYTTGSYGTITAFVCIYFCHDSTYTNSCLCVGDSTCGQRALYEMGMTGIPIYNVSSVLILVT